MHIDVIIDVVCPWCYVGKKELDLALASLDPLVVGGREITVAYHPYQLAPNTPSEGVDRSSYYEQKFGKDSPQLMEMRRYLTQRAAELGIEFDFDSPCQIANSMDSHRLIKWAKSEGKQGQIAEALMKAYFSDCAFLGDPNMLLQIAQQCGINKDIVAELLQTDKDIQEIKFEVDRIRSMGVSGVPFFIIDQKKTISGAESAMIIKDAIQSAF